jgi:DNA invertase Pin-like site-specific DNA recombinase
MFYIVNDNGVSRYCCDGAIDTTTASGELVFNLFSSPEQFERRLVQERTKAGLSAARARGQRGGRRPVQSDDPKVNMVKKMRKGKRVGINGICSTLRISRPTHYRYLTLQE